MAPLERHIRIPQFIRLVLSGVVGLRRFKQVQCFSSLQLPPKLFPSLLFSLLAVVHAESTSCDDLLRANAAGFVWVSAVDAEKQKVTLLAPAPLTNTNPTLIAGSIKWAS